MTPLDEIIQEYQSGAYMTTEKLLKAQRELSCHHYEMTKENVEAFRRWNTIKFHFTGSVAAAEVKAHEDVPELRITRKILESIKGVSIAIHSELNHINQD